ncbi:MAG: c-type cytochrome [Planctomycetales bacterium]|nr:c-type cytochrome [Planctomycetales bacterium]
MMTIQSQVPSYFHRFIRPQDMRTFMPASIGVYGRTFMVMAMIQSLVATCHAQDDAEDADYLPGVTAHYEAVRSGGARRVVVESRVSHVWHEQGPVDRDLNHRFRATWEGVLLFQPAGTYQLHAFVNGRVEIDIEGRRVLQADRQTEGWCATEEVAMPYGWHAVRIRFESGNHQPRLQLFWSSDSFTREPIAARYWGHIDQGTEHDDLYRRGFDLVRALRCGACHETHERNPLLPAPDLAHAAQHVSQDWLFELLDAHQRTEPSETLSSEKFADASTMPAFHIATEELRQISAYLDSRLVRSEDRDPRFPEGDPRTGEQLFVSIGCLACHSLGQVGGPVRYGGGELSTIGGKRSATSIALLLREPHRVNNLHRMPTFELSKQQAADLASYLVSLDKGESSHGAVHVDDAGAKQQVDERVVQETFMKWRCHACHANSRDPSLGERREKASVRVAWPAAIDWRDSCLGEANGESRRPGYQLKQGDRDAIRHYLTHVVESSSAPYSVGRRLMNEQNCVACHQRDGAPGIAPAVTAAVNIKPHLSAEFPAFVPPTLDNVGDKLHDHAIAAVLQGSQSRRRDWLQIQMPKFQLTDDQLHAMVAELVQADRMPLDEQSEIAEVDEAAARFAGGRLVTADGFGCLSCHSIGKVKPPKAPLNARGPNLAGLGQRIRYPWYRRWTADPDRIVPRIEMPSFNRPIHGVLQEDLDQQLAAVWSVLNQPDFKPPQPNPVRTVRASGVPSQSERAHILTDVVNHGENDRYIKPWILGLPNRHNVLFDVATGQLASWWIGDAARQRTEGKTWFWEIGGETLVDLHDDQADIQLVRDKRQLPLITDGQFPTELDRWEHSPEQGAEFSHRLIFGEGTDRTTLWIDQTWSPIWSTSDDPRSGFARRVHVRGMRRGDLVRLRLGRGIDERDSVDDEPAGEHLTVLLKKSPATSVALSARPVRAGFDGEGDAMWCEVEFGPDMAEITLEARYLTHATADTLPPITSVIPPQVPVTLQVVPGYDAIQLPLGEDWMPTAITWRPDGKMLVSSLKGQVWLAADTDGDALEDSAKPISDDLAAPYGLVALGNNCVDVINKYALLRLCDDDGDDFADRTVTIASGWGHTADYHDWAVGLAADDDGSYFIALPCEQDNRSLAAAHLRGQVLRLAKRTPSEAEPRLFSLQTLTAGHRFPMGIARSVDGNVFVTDNQGNYNPFNELNVIVPGKRYGFINSLEAKAGLTYPETPPTVAIPHPWTRSVNGICFLHDGPFREHLIGCEYDTQRLIRISLQRVGDTIQGACYPFSYYQPRGTPPLLGPICCAVAPNGDLVVGSLRDSGWGGANNIGQVVRLRQRERLPAGIREMRAVTDGFEIEFTQPVDESRASDRASYDLISSTRQSTPEYGGPDVARRTEAIRAITLSDDARIVTLQLDGWREGFVYELRLRNLASGDAEFFPSEAFYTLRAVPR